MEIVEKALFNNLEEIVSIDNSIIGNESRRSYIKKAIKKERCLIVKRDGSIVGFLIYDTNFFDCSFISLIMVSPTERRRGYATMLMEYFEKVSPTSKIFSSTNQSNKQMHKVFDSNGFIRSGVVENLDDGDPEIIYFKSK